MSAHTASPANAGWHDRHSKVQHTLAIRLGFGSFPPIAEEPTRVQVPPIETRPPLIRSHKRFSYSIGSTFGVHHHQSLLSRISNPETLEKEDLHGIPSSRFTDLNRSDPVLAQRSESAPTSPVPQLTPTSAEADQEEAHGEIDDEMEMGLGDLDEEDVPVEGETPKTVAERRAEKRKMKRFR